MYIPFARVRACATWWTVPTFLVAIATALLYHLDTRLFFDTGRHTFQPYGLIYVAAAALLTWRGGRRLGFVTLSLALVGAAYVLPPRDTMTIGDRLGWAELGALMMIGATAVLVVGAWPRTRGAVSPKREWRKRLNKLVFRAYALSEGSRQHDFVFIFSHMRSGSSLLTHLLATHPEVCGYGETHLTYSRPSDFDALIGKVMLMRRRFPGTLRERYVLDKVLHNFYLGRANLSLLRQRHAHVVFLTREPRGAIASMMQTFGYTETRALDHYLTRLKAISDAALALTDQASPAAGERPVAMTYRQLLEQTEPSFRLLERSLGLSEPLHEEYRVLPTTGTAKIGDTSENIRSGAIIRAERTPPRLSAATLTRAEEAYRQCQSVLTQTCLCVADADAGAG